MRRAESVARKASLPAQCAESARISGGELLGSYTDENGRRREIIALPGAGRSTLVIDCRGGTPEEGRLVAHLAEDEPSSNASLVCSLYLAGGHGRCRRVTPRDLVNPPLQGAPAESGAAQELCAADIPWLTDRDGYMYLIERAQSSWWAPELRWRKHFPVTALRTPRVVGLREVVGALEDYEPARTFTYRKIAAHSGQQDVSTIQLHRELVRLDTGPLILNRGLREAVLASGLRLGEIALRCEHTLGDEGKARGDTSWLARRIGLMPNSGESAPRPWVHSAVLALIAREGLGISPREVELG